MHVLSQFHYKFDHLKREEKRREEKRREEKRREEKRTPRLGKLQAVKLRTRISG
jgi:hypothetical protein